MQNKARLSLPFLHHLFAKASLSGRPMVVMLDTNIEQLLEVSERVRRVAEVMMAQAEEKTIHCSINIGAMIIDASNVSSVRNPVSPTSKVLYKAKLQNRNKIVIDGLERDSVAIKTESTSPT